MVCPFKQSISGHLGVFTIECGALSRIGNFPARNDDHIGASLTVGVYDFACAGLF
jgi:hypothetical protein